MAFICQHAGVPRRIAWQPWYVWQHKHPLKVQHWCCASSHLKMHEPDRHAHQLALHCTALAEVAALADGLLAAADHVKVDVPSQLVTKSFLYSALQKCRAFRVYAAAIGCFARGEQYAHLQTEMQYSNHTVAPNEQRKSHLACDLHSSICCCCCNCCA